MQHLEPAALIERLRAKIAAISDWLDEIEQEAGDLPLGKAADLAKLHRQLTKARASLRRRLAETEGATGQDSRLQIDNLTADAAGEVQAIVGACNDLDQPWRASEVASTDATIRALAQLVRRLAATVGASLHHFAVAE